MADPNVDEMALNEPGVEDTPDTPPVAENNPAEDVTPPEPEVVPEGEPGVKTETDGEVPDKVPEGEPKKGENQRVRELVKQKNAAKAKAQSLAAKLAEVTGTIEPRADIQPQATSVTQDKPVLVPGEEIDAAEFEKRLQAREQKTLQKADALAIIRGKQQEAITRINTEANDVIKEYSQLDPDSDDFDQELSEAVTEAVEASVRADPFGASVKGLVGKLMKPYQRAITKEVGNANENLAKQVSKAALRPTAVKPPEQPVGDKSLKDMEKELGVVY